MPSSLYLYKPVPSEYNSQTKYSLKGSRPFPSLTWINCQLPTIELLLFALLLAAGKGVSSSQAEKIIDTAKNV